MTARMIGDCKTPGWYTVKTPIGTWSVEATDGWSAINNVKSDIKSDPVLTGLDMRGRWSGWIVTKERG
jgi:hypothetical protein